MAVATYPSPCWTDTRKCCGRSADSPVTSTASTAPSGGTPQGIQSWIRSPGKPQEPEASSLGGGESPPPLSPRARARLGPRASIRRGRGCQRRFVACQLAVSGSSSWRVYRISNIFSRLRFMTLPRPARLTATRQQRDQSEAAIARIAPSRGAPGANAAPGPAASRWPAAHCATRSRSTLWKARPRVTDVPATHSRKSGACGPPATRGTDSHRRRMTSPGWPCLAFSATQLRDALLAA
jgi:hypothetical protein